jgi:trehalose 6-phosphate synthase/phosphatase
LTPAALDDQANPFSKVPKLSTAATLAAAAQAMIKNQEQQAKEADARLTRKHQTTHSEQSPRLRRKSSRSAIRRTPSQKQHWRIESNSHCNGGLKNAFDCMEEKLHETLWIGALGTSTDKFDPALREDIDRKMSDEYSSVPVWIPDKEFEEYYDEFCHQVRF